jgi:hypothetical protein
MLSLNENESFPFALSHKPCTTSRVEWLYIGRNLYELCLSMVLSANLWSENEIGHIW